MASKNEAKVIFKAATEQFDAAIKDSKAEISYLSGELDKNSKALRGNEDDAELLAQRVELLTRKKQEQANVVENLRHELDAARFAYGENSTEVTKLAGTVGKAEASLMGLETALGKAESKLDQAESAYGQLTAEIDRQKSELKQLEAAYVSAAIESGEASAEAKQLEGKMNSLNAELQQNEAKLSQAEDAARRLARGFDDAEKEADDLKNSIGELAAGTMLADFATNAASSLAGLDEATQEHRQNMAMLNNAYEWSGRSVEDATETYQRFLGITGDSDQATEAAQLMNNLADAGGDIDEWYTIACGTMSAFGNALPVETLIESANESIRCGQIVGSLADAINWTSINSERMNYLLGESHPKAMEAFNKALAEGASSEDAMNAALAECSTEQERQELLATTLSLQYSELGTGFEALNEEVVASRIASDELVQAQSAMASEIAPLTTGIKSLAADGLNFLANNLNWVIPIVGVAAGAFGALWLAVNGGSVLASVKAGITGVGVALGGVSAPILIAIAAITAIAAAIVYLWNTNEDFRNNVILIWNNVRAAIAEVCQALSPIVQAAFESISSIVDTLMNGSVATTISGALTFISGIFQTVCGAIVAITTGDFTTLSNGVNAILSGLKTIVSGIFSGIKDAIATKIEGARTAVSNAIEKIKSAFNFSWSLPHLKLPHITISGSFSLNPPRVPSFGISWYAKAMDKAMVLTSPTIFGFQNGRFLGGGDAGNEVVAGESHLVGLMGSVVQEAMRDDGTDRVVNAIEKLAERVTVLEMDGQALATATASYNDAVNGSRQMLVDRGLSV